MLRAAMRPRAPAPIARSTALCARCTSCASRLSARRLAGRQGRGARRITTALHGLRGRCHELTARSSRSSWLVAHRIEGTWRRTQRSLPVLISIGRESYLFSARTKRAEVPSGSDISDRSERGARPLA